jgi:hypothetical protein
MLLQQAQDDWRKSSFSAITNHCVEVRFTDAGVEVRDSKDRGGPSLRFDSDKWAEFIGAIQEGAFDASR